MKPSTLRALQDAYYALSQEALSGSLSDAEAALYLDMGEALTALTAPLRAAHEESRRKFKNMLTMEDEFRGAD